MKKTFNYQSIDFFDINDAWVFTSLFNCVKNNKEIILRDLIAFGDYINHSIFSKEELITGLVKLQKKNLIIIENKKIKYTKHGKEIIKMCSNRKDSLFSRTEIILHILNSKIKYLKEIDTYDKCNFITKSKLNSAYKEYMNILKK